MGLMMAGLAISAAGAAQQAAAAKAAAKSQQNQANYNAQVQENEAKAKEQAAAFEAKRAAKTNVRERSTLKTRLAKAGGLGSPVADDLSGFQESEQELDQLLIGFDGETAATRARNQGTMDRASGRAARARGRSKATGAYVSGAGTFATSDSGQTLLRGFNN